VGQGQVPRQQVAAVRQISIDIDGPTRLLQLVCTILGISDQLKGLTGRRHAEQPITHIVQRRIESKPILQLFQCIGAARRPLEAQARRRQTQHTRADPERAREVHFAGLIPLAPVHARLPTLGSDRDCGARR
jgi:hypothetical protein